MIATKQTAPAYAAAGIICLTLCGAALIVLHGRDIDFAGAFVTLGAGAIAVAAFLALLAARWKTRPRVAFPDWTDDMRADAKTERRWIAVAVLVASAGSVLNALKMDFGVAIPHALFVNAFLVCAAFAIALLTESWYVMRLG